MDKRYVLREAHVDLDRDAYDSVERYWDDVIEDVKEERERLEDAMSSKRSRMGYAVKNSDLLHVAAPGAAFVGAGSAASFALTGNVWESLQPIGVMSPVLAWVSMDMRDVVDGMEDELSAYEAAIKTAYEARDT